MNDTGLTEHEGIDPTIPARLLQVGPGEPLWVQAHSALCMTFVLLVVGAAALYPRWLLGKLGRHGRTLAAVLAIAPILLPLEPLALYPDPWDDVVLRTIIAAMSPGLGIVFSSLLGPDLAIEKDDE